MPELPEMETYRNLLSEKIVGETITTVEVTREKSINVPVPNFLQTLQGKTITNITRRAKQLIFELNNGYSLVLHLMLGGWLYFGNENDSPKRTKQITLTFNHGSLYFIGLRLGYLHLIPNSQLNDTFRDLGPEPLESSFTTSAFLEHVKNRRGMLKTTLVNQSFIAGIGNCYSDEICFESHFLPMTKMSELTDQQKQRLHEAIVTVLRSGIAQGGYMDNPLTKTDNLTGGYKTLVYDREGEPCIRCNSSIILEEISSRKCFYCPKCQK